MQGNILDPQKILVQNTLHAGTDIDGSHSPWSMSNARWPYTHVWNVVTEKLHLNSTAFSTKFLI